MNVIAKVNELKMSTENTCLVYACNLESMQACCILSAYDKQMDTLDVCLEHLECDSSQAVWGIYPVNYSGDSTKEFYDIAVKAKKEYDKEVTQERVDRIIAHIFGM